MKVLFVCHGNICRSAMAEAMFINKLRINNIEGVVVDSCATSLEEIGNSMYNPAKNELIRRNIPLIDHKARQITKNDYTSSDLIICFDYNNKRNIEYLIGDSSKVKLIKEYIGINDIVDDPWYTRNFSLCYEEIDKCLDEIIKIVRK